MVRTPAFQAENPGSIPGRVKISLSEGFDPKQDMGCLAYGNRTPERAPQMLFLCGVMTLLRRESKDGAAWLRVGAGDRGEWR